jgi:hypothetical protein
LREEKEAEKEAEKIAAAPKVASPKGDSNFVRKSK